MTPLTDKQKNLLEGMFGKLVEEINQERLAQKGFSSHELARILLTLPDLPVATEALNSTYMSKADERSHGPLRVGRLVSYAGDHILIGNITKRQLNPPNWYVSEMYVGDAPEQWSW